jgi:phosphocarrier protein
MSVEGSVTVHHIKGLHARPASVFVNTASEFESEIRVGKTGADELVDAKSSLAIMSLGVEEGDEITITANGADSEQAIKRLITVVEADFELHQE